MSSASIWHSRLVRFFQAQAPSPRRCEELPWHLNKCYRWHPLKNSLVNLRTFEASLYGEVQPQIKLKGCSENPDLKHSSPCFLEKGKYNTIFAAISCVQTMWTTTQLRRELMDYWKLLTEGPLHASEEAAAVDLKNDSKSRLLRCLSSPHHARYLFYA